MAHKKGLPGRNAGWKRFYLLYTVLFLAVALLVFAPFIRSGKSLVWSNDGLYQRYNIFVYIGSYLRTIIKNLVFNHTLEIPMWEFSIGYGGDVLTYLFGDPFDLFSVFVPTAYAEYAYGALIVLRIYLAGIALSCFCRKMDCQQFPTLCGMFVYAFCSFSITSCVRQPYFLNPMIYLPLILLGVEKILRKESPVVFILFVALEAFSSFYFFYMVVLLTVLYVVFRLFNFVKEHRVRNFLFHVLRLGGYAVIGLAIASILFIPKAYLYLGDTRSDTDYQVQLFYSLKEYSSMLGSYVNNGEPILWGRIGQSPIVLLGIGGLFLEKKKDGWLKGLFLLMTAFLLFPVAGYVFNGFSYTSNRWVFGYSFLCAFILVKQLPSLMNLSTKKKAALSLGSCVYATACILMAYSRTESAMLGCVILFCSLLFLIWIPQLRTIQWKRLVIQARRIAQVGVFVLAIAGVLALSFYRYSFTEMDFVGDFIDSGKVLSRAVGNRSKVWDLIDDDSFYRIDETSSGGPSNYLLSSGQSTTVQYWSLTNTSLSEYLSLNSATSGKNYAIKGLLSRSLLAPFASAKYFTCSEGQEKYVPYGYTLLGTSGKYQVYESDLSLPLGYTCSTLVSYEDYAENLSAVERQEAMLQGAVVSEEETEVYQTLETAEVTYANQSLDYELEYDSSEIERTQSGFLVESAGASITLTFDCPEDCELYVYFNNLEFQSISSYDLRTEDEWESYTTYEKNVADWNHKYATENTSASVKASSNGVSASATCYTEHNIYTNGRTEYLLNLCYSEEGRTTLTVTFSATGLYTFDSMSVVAQPMEGVEEYLSAMKEDVLEDEVVETNRITGTISLDESKLLCLSIPYSEGWTAYVDGEEAELIRTNVAYMGLLLDAGDHTIELRYTTPYLKIGAIVSCIGVAALIVCCVVRRRRKKDVPVEKKP
ncbi:MAG: YfhO family protein [Clostridiales bacterium]|nr:YfhO family protein [Clostridiales bacterium]